MPVGPIGNLPQLTMFNNDDTTSLLGLQWNTVVQGGGALFADLRAFIGYPGQVVLVSGATALADGGQGLFQFVQLTGGTLPPPDDNFFVLQCPASNWPRAYWARIPVFATINVYDIAMNYSQVPPSGQVFLAFVACRRFTTPLNLVGSQAVSVNGPTTGISYALLRNAVQFGTISFAAGTGAPMAGTFAATAQTWAPGDVLTVQAPSITYGSADVAITIEGSAF